MENDLIALLGDAATPEVQAMIREASLDPPGVPMSGRVFPSQDLTVRPARKKKKKKMIRRGLNPMSTFVAGAPGSKLNNEATIPKKKFIFTPGGRKRKVKADAIMAFRQMNPTHGFPPTYWSVGSVALSGYNEQKEETKDSKFKVGDRVRVRTGKAHDKMTEDKEGTVVDIATDALAIKFEGMTKVHKWYVDAEVELLKSDEVEEQKRGRRKKKGPKGIAPTQQYWIGGVAAGLPNQYGDYSQADVPLGTLITEDGDGRWITVQGRKILIGAAPLRSTTVHKVGEVQPIFNQPKVLAFEKQIPEIAKNYDGVHLVKTDRTAGVWQSSREASFLLSGDASDSLALDAFAAKLGEAAPERQMATVRFSENEEGKGAAYELHGVKDEEHAVQTLLNHGFEGQTVPIGQGRIILFDHDGSLHANVDKATKELGISYDTTKGDVRFIGENDYKSAQNDYRRSKGQAEEVLHLGPGGPSSETRRHLIEQITADILRLMERGDGHFITIDGRAVFIANQRGAGPELQRGQTTKQAFYDPRKKAYTPEREQLHEDATETMVEGKVGPTDRKPIAYILGGGTSSGKTTASRTLIAENPHMVRIDPDELKLGVPEYEALKESDPQNAAARVHDESKDITAKLMAKAQARRLDLTYDTTTSSDNGADTVRGLVKNGYDVRVHFIDIPVSEAIKRAAKRAAESKDPINRDRIVPDYKIRESHQGAAEKFFEVKDIPGITEAKMHDNLGKVARVVYEKYSDGHEVTHDPERFAQYKRKAEGKEE